MSEDEGGGMTKEVIRVYLSVSHRSHLAQCIFRLLKSSVVAVLSLSLVARAFRVEQYRGRNMKHLSTGIRLSIGVR